jgi:hypothetical protein
MNSDQKSPFIIRSFMISDQKSPIIISYLMTSDRKSPFIIRSFMTSDQKSPIGKTLMTFERCPKHHAQYAKYALSPPWCGTGLRYSLNGVRVSANG